MACIYQFFIVNLMCLKSCLLGKRVIFFHLDSASQFIHIEPIILGIIRHYHYDCRLVFLVKNIERKTLHQNLMELGLENKNIYSPIVGLFSIFWHKYITVEQRSRTPYFSFLNSERICIFHGQPTKGNVYKGFKADRFDTLLMYGPLMYRYFLEQQQNIKRSECLNIIKLGQPKSDLLVNYSESKMQNIQKLCKNRLTVMYAPSFETYSSLSIEGDKILRKMMNLDINIIFKPHPAFFNLLNEPEKCPNANFQQQRWENLLNEIAPRICSPLDNDFDDKFSLYTADVILTDYSGIAFDAIIMGRPVLYLPADDFFDTHGPQMTNMDSTILRNSVYHNAGRSYGRVISNVEDLVKFSHSLCDEPWVSRRKSLKAELLYNPGTATGKLLSYIFR